MASDQDNRKIKRPLENDERISISRMLQLRMLDEIARIARVDQSGIIFHGGTNICTTFGSARWSEDLDFMATPDAVERIFRYRMIMERGLRLWGSMNRPGSHIELQEKTDGHDPQVGDVERLQIRWENPDRIGAIKIKVEFYVAEPEMISGYKRMMTIPRVQDREGSCALPCAVPVSVWADKMVAMALRPVLKHRDMHDLGFICRHLKYDLTSDDDRKNALEASMRVYGKNVSDIIEGLERHAIKEGIQDFSAFSADMRRWFPADVFANMNEVGIMDRLYFDFHKEFEKGMAISKAIMTEKDPPSSTEESCPQW